MLYSATYVLTHGSPGLYIVHAAVRCEFRYVAFGPTVMEKECLVFFIPVGLGFSIGTIFKRT